MSETINTIDNMWGLLVFPWLALFICSRIWRQSLLNCFLALVAICSTLLFICFLFGEYTVYAILVCIVLVTLLLLSVPGLLTYNGLVMMRNEGRSLANMLSLLMGIAVAIGEFCFIFFCARILSNYGMGLIEKITGFIGFTAFYLCVIFVAFMFYAIIVSNIPFTCNFDYIIIHGCGLIDGHQVSRLLSQRLDTAIMVYNKSEKKPILIPSGGRGWDEAISEAEGMSRYLISQGIPETAIIKEDQSTSTETNLSCSRDIIESRGSGKVALVSSNYHVYRCLRLARRIRLKCTGIGSPVAGYYWPSALIREFVGVFSDIPSLILLLIGWSWIPLFFFMVY